MSILNPTPQEIDDDKIRTYREYWNPPKTAITNPTIEELHNDLNALIKHKEEESRVAKSAYDEQRLSTRVEAPEHFKQTTFIVAGTHSQYLDWLKRKGYSEKEYKYVMGPETLRGISAENLKGIFIGTWRNRSDINEIKNQIAVIKSKLSDGTIVSGLSGTTVYYDGQNYPVSIGGSGGGGVISSGGVATYGTYDVATTIVSAAEIIREKLHDEIKKLTIINDVQQDIVLSKINAVLDEY